MRAQGGSSGAWHCWKVLFAIREHLSGWRMLSTDKPTSKSGQ
jgi:hypothetical protein